MAADMSLFLKALNEGRIISASSLQQMHDWRKMRFPLEYGYGTMRFAQPRPIRAITGIPLLWGHSGSTGSFLYYAQDLDLYMAGTTDQVEGRMKPFLLMREVMNAVRGARADKIERAWRKMSPGRSRGSQTQHAHGWNDDLLHV